MLGQRLMFSVGRGATMALLVLGLAACGETPGGLDTPDEGTVIVPPASPDAGEVPDVTNQAAATIVDGKLDPSSFGGLIGNAFELVITGDGTEHTFAIEELVDETTIAATGETTIGFTIEGEPGDLAITLDGENAGTFQRQSPSGVVSD